MRASLEARVHDPLWLLGRQWQFGEFRGTDGGSPVIARFRAECSRLNRYFLGLPAPDASVAAKEYDSDELPLEVLAERERIRAEEGPTVHMAVEAGLQFLRLLAREGVSEATRSAYVNNYPLDTPALEELDGETLRFLSVMRGRVPDGVGIYEDVRDVPRQPDGTPSELPAERLVSAGERDKVAGAVGRWLKWFESLFSEPPGDESAWSAERMEYGFAIATRMADRDVVLTAREYAEGHLDWSSFSVDPSVSLGAPAEAEPETITATSIPAPVTFRGMPAARWWEFEDAQVDLGAIEADPEDLARLLLVEFASIYGNDWFEVPIDLKVGSICWPRSLIVIDTFGERTLIRPYTEVDSAGTSAWRMFHLSPDFFFLAPALASSLHSAPIEDVLFLRDEMANMAWAVERVVESSAGRRLRRFEAFQEEQERGRREGERTAPPEQPSTGGAALVYRLASSVPPYWIPFLPQKVDESSIRLRRGTLPEGSPAIQPKGRILEPHRTLSLFEEEVPRTGARVTRAYQYARWIDGSTHLWIGRRKRPGRGEGSSGLRFDIVGPA
jgi:hypothetical protein